MRLLYLAGLTLALLAGCGAPSGGAAPAGGIPATISASGDPTRGQVVFDDQGCFACHSTGADQLVGPGLAGSLSPAGPVYPPGADYGGALPNGQPRTEEAMAGWIRSGGMGKIGVMPPRELSAAEMADLLAYLRTLER